jgi:hypothetical protein
MQGSEGHLLLYSIPSFRLERPSDIVQAIEYVIPLLHISR